MQRSLDYGRCDTPETITSRDLRTADLETTLKGYFASSDSGSCAIGPSSVSGDKKRLKIGENDDQDSRGRSMERTAQNVAIQDNAVSLMGFGGFVARCNLMKLGKRRKATVCLEDQESMDPPG